MNEKEFLILLILFGTLILSFILTPIVKRIALKLKVIDHPDHRKVHQENIPRLGGIAIYLSFLIGYGTYVVLFDQIQPLTIPLFLGTLFIVITGIFDDIFSIHPLLKLLGQFTAATVFVLFGNLHITVFNLPFFSNLDLGNLSIPITILWIVAIINAINLIDGLDGLAVGVSSIAFLTIIIMSILMGNLFAAIIAGFLLMSSLGFLYYNFYPAKIFMGDTGSMFLGYMLAVISLMGFKSVTFISVIIPMVILAIPILDTVYAIIRRVVNKQSITSADKSHLHHCLMRMGFTHRQSVLIIYTMSIFFSGIAFIFTTTYVWLSVILFIGALIVFEILAEKIGLVNSEYKPLLKFYHQVRILITRNGEKPTS